MPRRDHSPRSGRHPTYPDSWQAPAPTVRRGPSERSRRDQVAKSSTGSAKYKGFPQRRASNRNEFDGPSQLLDRPDDGGLERQEEEVARLPSTLSAQEQDTILSQANDRLSRCAFDFVATYQFPIPIEPDKRPVREPGDREWPEWVFLLKRLATKRRIPARVLYDGQIKQLVAVLENSLEIRPAPEHQPRPLKDDRHILQLLSSALQVTKMLKDAPALLFLDALYVQTEGLIQTRTAPQLSTAFEQM